MAFRRAPRAGAGGGRFARPGADLEGLLNITIGRSAAIAAAAAFLALAAAGASHAASGENRHVTIVNHTRHTITEFYASNTGANDWEEDILGKDELARGESIDINIDDGTGKCKFDFKAVFSDGESLEKSNINVCEIESYEYTE